MIFINKLYNVICGIGNCKFDTQKMCGDIKGEELLNESRFLMLKMNFKGFISWKRSHPSKPSMKVGHLFNE